MKNWKFEDWAYAIMACTFAGSIITALLIESGVWVLVLSSLVVVGVPLFIVACRAIWLGYKEESK